MHSYSDALKNEVQKIRVTRPPASALVEGPLWYHYKVSKTTQKVFTVKRLRFYGLKMQHLLSKLGGRAREGTPYSLISQVSLGIYEAFYEEF